MSRIRVYFTPYVNQEIFGEEIEVTNFVQENSLNRLRQQVDNTEFDIGVFKFDDTQIIMNNQSGLFGQPGDGVSIFGVRRSGSKVRIAWEVEDNDLECGFVYCGERFLSEPIDIFKGILNDDASTEDIQTQTISFKILGREGVFDLIEAPSTFLVGDTFKEAMIKALDNSLITDLFTVDPDNITPPLDLELDAVDQWEGATVKEVFDDLLAVSNSILYIRDETLFITDREEGPDVEFTFYGQTAFDGIENIQNISKVKISLNRTFNFWKWGSFISRDVGSIATYGVKKKEFSFDGITDNAKIATIIDELKAEFAAPKREFDLTTPMTYQVMELFIGDQVRVDYPTIYRTKEGQVLPYYESSIYDEATYPVGEFALTINKDVPHKIMGRTIDMKNQLVTFRIREV